MGISAWGRGVAQDAGSAAILLPNIWAWRWGVYFDSRKGAKKAAHEAGRPFVAAGDLEGASRDRKAAQAQ